jgi:hypothetical protein
LRQNNGSKTLNTIKPTMNKFVLSAFSCALLLLGSTTSYAQYNQNDHTPLTLLEQSAKSIEVINSGNYIPGVEGSPFLSEEWSQGRIIMNDGNVFDPIDLRLNVYQNEMHYRYKGAEYSIKTPEKVKEITMGGRRFIYYPYKKGNSIAHGYFEVLVEGKTELLVLFYMNRVKSNYNASLNVGDKNDHLELKERYFICTSSSIVEIDKKGKSIFDSLGEKGDALKKWIKEKDLSFKKKEDMVKIVTYLNGMN